MFSLGEYPYWTSKENSKEISSIFKKRWKGYNHNKSTKQKHKYKISSSSTE